MSVGGTSVAIGVGFTDVHAARMSIIRITIRIFFISITFRDYCRLTASSFRGASRVLAWARSISHPEAITGPRSDSGAGPVLAFLAREQPRIDHTMKKPGADPARLSALRAVRGVCES